MDSFNRSFALELFRYLPFEFTSPRFLNKDSIQIPKLFTSNQIPEIPQRELAQTSLHYISQLLRPLHMLLIKQLVSRDLTFENLLIYQVSHQKRYPVLFFHIQSLTQLNR